MRRAGTIQKPGTHRPLDAMAEEASYLEHRAPGAWWADPALAREIGEAPDILQNLTKYPLCYLPTSHQDVALSICVPSLQLTQIELAYTTRYF
jgi:hypothetical protein